MGMSRRKLDGGTVIIDKGKKRNIIKESSGKSRESGRFMMWMLFAVLSSIFAALTSILAKVGIEGVNSNLATAVRTVVVLIMAWGMVFLTGGQSGLSSIGKKSWIFLILSGLATGASWLCYYRALQSGPASVVVPIDKLSILVTVAFSRLVFQERLTSRSAAGLALIVAGTLAMLF